MFEILHTQANVRTVAIGGVPRNAPMEGIGGVRGGPIQNVEMLLQWASVAYTNAEPEISAKWNDTALGAFYSIGNCEGLLKRAAYSSNKASANVNNADSFRIGDATQTPLEFVYDPADCRLFYTHQMVKNVTNTWQGVADAMWGSENGIMKCVPGSTGARSSLPL